MAGAALSEVAPGPPATRAAEAMFEVQAIVARTYAAAHRGRHAREGFDLCSTTHCQIYEPARLATSRWAPVVRDAVQRTAGAGPHVRRRAGRRGVPRRLRRVDERRSGRVGWAATPVPARPAGRRRRRATAHVAWQYAVDARRAAARARRRSSQLRIERTARRDHRGLAGCVRARAAVLLRRGPRAQQRRRPFAARSARSADRNAFGIRSIRSTLFDVVANGREFVFSGSGFGHGVGLCQVGALARVTAGEDAACGLDALLSGHRIGAVTPSSHTRRD